MELDTSSVRTKGRKLTGLLLSMLAATADTAAALAGTPSQVRDLRASDISPYALTLSWSAPSGDALGLELRECLDEAPDSCQRVALLNADTTQLRYHAWAAGQFRTLRLRAFNAQGASADTQISILFPLDAELEAAKASWPGRQSENLESVGQWQLYEPESEAQWDAMRASGWGQRCTSRSELLQQDIPTLRVRLQAQGELRLQDGGQVDSFSLHDSDTECDFGRCPERIAFGRSGDDGCYRYLGGLRQIAAPIAPGLKSGWPRGLPAQQQLLRTDTSEIVDEYTHCAPAKAALELLQPPFQQIDGRTAQCQGAPLAER